MTAARDLLPKATEAELAEHVRQAAELGGWLAYHTHDSRRSAGGFPDWTFCLPGVGLGAVVFAELKGYDRRGRLGTLTADQRGWLEALRAAGAYSYLWTPDDLALVDEVLVRRRPARPLPPLPALNLRKPR